VTLTIISHTEHYLSADGTVLGLGSTVTEINELLALFDEITHIAMLHDSIPPANALPYRSDAITFVPIPAVGGSKLRDKLAILPQIPHIIGILKKQLKTSDCFQFRAPTGIGVFVIPYLMFFNEGKGWFKYAGNWKQAHAPLAYRFQKWLLEGQSRNVTINGFWEDQPAHCLSFENPCLTQEEVQEGQKFIEQKKLKPPYDFCFVGRLEAAKGVDILLNAFMNLKAHERSKIGTIHLVGDGSRMDYYKTKVATSDLQFRFHGILSRTDVKDIYKHCHAIVLPSASEGFPKVIAEALNFGCLPIVSDVSSIGHYIHHGTNGFLLKRIDEDGLREALERFLNLTEKDYNRMICSSANLIQKFTYAWYLERLQTDVL